VSNHLTFAAGVESKDGKHSSSARHETPSLMPAREYFRS
jgi:hypothetical protein